MIGYQEINKKLIFNRYFYILSSPWLAEFDKVYLDGVNNEQFKVLSYVSQWFTCVCVMLCYALNVNAWGHVILDSQKDPKTNKILILRTLLWIGHVRESDREIHAKQFMIKGSLYSQY